MIKQFIDICKMSAIQLKNYLRSELTKIYGTDNVIATPPGGYLYAKGTFPVLLVAHLDTVHVKLPTHITNKNGIISALEGIGGDDRCGVYMILQIIKKYNCSVVFCDEEEVGGIGAEIFAKDYKGLKFNYIIEFDRANANDAVFYDCDNYNFEKFITQSYYTPSHGTFSDISIIAPELGVAAVNLSCGYYKAHTANEYVNIKEMQNSINAAIEILQRTNIETDIYEYVPYQESKYFSNYYDDGYTEGIYYIEYGYDGQVAVEYALSKYEALGLFLYEHPTLTYNDVSNIYLTEDEKLW